MVYRSKVDWWIGLLLLAMPVMFLGIAFKLLADGESVGGYLNLGILAFLLALYGFALFPLRYELDEQGLTIRTGFFRRRTPFREILNVRRTCNPLSAPALSLDRLRIDTGRRLPLLISPCDQQAFLVELASRCPHLVLSPGRLEPASGMRSSDTSN